eukprot:Polyplicarium_translucidae@DN3070_c0_g1_i10.p1
MLSTAPALLADAEGAGNVALAEVSFFCFCFLSAAALQWIVSKIPAYAPPVSIVWFVYGLLAQLVVHYVESNTFLAAGIDTMARIDSNIPYYVLLPILLYEATQNINWHKFRRFLLTFPAVVTDLQQVVAFVDVHEELLLKGGDSLQQLLGPKLLDTFYSAILEAKNFVPQIREAYPESFRFAVVVHAATLCLNLKEQLVEDQAQRGLLLDEDTLVLKRLFADQHFNLSRFRPVGVRLAEDGTQRT